jgi:hypothetical protein
MKAVGLGLVALGALAMSSCVTTTPSTPRGSTEKVSIAIPEFVPRTSGPEEIHFAQILPEIIRQDLRFSTSRRPALTAPCTATSRSSASG